MQAESLFQPISRDAIRRARARLAFDGMSVEDWAAANGYKAKTVYQVLSGKRPCIRGTMFKIAVALGLRPNPEANAYESLSRQNALPPAGRTVGERAPVGSCDRSAKLHLGEPVR